MTPVRAISDATFVDEVERSSGIVAVDFWAEWCAPCRVAAPVLERVAGDFDGRVRVLSLDVDAHPEVAARFRIRNLPTILLFRDGAVVDRIVGLLSEPALRARFAEVLSS